jgi:hypothetical protein
MQLECALHTFPLRELLDLCIRSLITGAVEVETPAGCHRIFVRAGRIYHAESPTETGFDAIWPLFELADAPFTFRAGLSSHERTIDERPARMLLRAQCMASEWKTIRPVIASLDVVPHLVVPENIEAVKVDEEHWTTLCLADGVHTIREIAAEAGVEHVDACRILIRLYKRGLVRLDQQRPRTPIAPLRPKPSLLQASNHEGAASFFARLLADLPADGMPKENTHASERAAQVDSIVRLLSAG